MNCNKEGKCEKNCPELSLEKSHDQMSVALEQSPTVALQALDELWFQVAGTLCNLECTHCFISCSPKNDSFGHLSLETVRQALQESIPLGVKEYYFTGGEPFLNKEMVAILEETLQYGSATVLTNGTFLKDEWLSRLRVAEDRSGFTLEFRVSIDGPTAEINDPIRGERTFARALIGVEKLVHAGFLPIITMTRTWNDEDDQQILADFREVLSQHGYHRARLKILPRLKIGAEAERSSGYDQTERVTSEMMFDYDQSQLVCTHSRVVSDRGVHVCPILLESPDSILGDSLAESMQPFSLNHGACFTCYLYGSICTNASSSHQE